MTYVKGKKRTKATNNPTTLNEACESMVKIVHKITYKWTRNHYQDYDDIFQEGMMGVIHAWGKFDGSEHQANGYRFTTYAYMWVKAFIKPYVEKNWTRMNNLVSEDLSDLHDREEFGYDIDYNTLDLERRIEKLPIEDRVIFEMRKKGSTFAEIAEELNGDQTLHQVRNRFLEMVG